MGSRSFLTGLVMSNDVMDRIKTGWDKKRWFTTKYTKGHEEEREFSDRINMINKI